MLIYIGKLKYCRKITMKDVANFNVEKSQSQRKVSTVDNRLAYSTRSDFNKNPVLESIVKPFVHPR